MQSLCPESGLRTAPNWQKIQKVAMTSQFSDMTSTSDFFDVVLFLLSSLVTGPSFMSISLLVLKPWQFSFIRDWPEIWKSEILPSELCQISGDWGELWIPNLAGMSLTEYYSKLQNSRVTVFTAFELLRENQLRGQVKLPPSTHTHTHARTHARTHACTHTLGLINVMYVISSLLVSDLSNLHLPRKSKQNKHFRYHIYFCI